MEAVAQVYCGRAVVWGVSHGRADGNQHANRQTLAHRLCGEVVEHDAQRRRNNWNFYAQVSQCLRDVTVILTSPVSLNHVEASAYLVASYIFL